MKRTGRIKARLHRIGNRYRDLPRGLRSRRLSERNSAQKLLAATICIPIMLACLGYMISWELTRRQIERDNAAFSALYSASTPTETPTIRPTAAPTPSPTVEPTAAPTAATTVTPVPTITPEPAMTSEPTPMPTPSPTPFPTPDPFEIVVDETLPPLATPDAQTIIFAMETPPPTQASFGDLLSLNPETVGFLYIDDILSLPVVQRPNDNQHYLNHSFSGEESLAGTLFLDGSNLLVPEDPSLIVYGHNMRNGTMFRPLIQYEQLSFLKEHPLVQFDTIYRNQSYVPFAVLSVTADEGSERYVNIRRFMFDESEWDSYISEIRALSVHDIPVDVRYGDSVLLLVTCEYTHNNGRFVVALRALRDGETPQDARAMVQAAR